MDLTERAKLGISYFTELIEERLDYEMYFGTTFNHNPPVAALYLTGLSCCQCKALEVMPMLRIWNSELIGLDNVVLTPHIGGSTEEALRLMGILAAENVVKVLNGEIPHHIFNQEVKKNN